MGSLIKGAVVRSISVVMIVGFAVLSQPAVALEQQDALWTRKALKTMDLGDWNATGRFARRVKDPLARRFLAWNVLSNTNNVATFELIDAFLRESPDWPHQRQLRKRAEETMKSRIPTADKIAWFAINKPVSATGKSRLAGALVKVGRTEEARALVQKVWISGNFPRAEEKAFYKKFRKYLTRQDHIKRLDRLLWDGKYGATRRMLRHVPKDWQALAQARYSLRRRTGNVDFLIKRVPQSLKDDPGLAYERLRWRRRKGKDDAVNILLSPPDNLVRPELWWKERATLARRLLLKGHVSDAYRIVSEHHLSNGAAFADAEWMSGWIALRFLADHTKALEHFSKMFAAVKYPISRARGAYWSGRALEAAGKDEDAKAWYSKASAYPTTYYGQLALAKIKPGQSLSFVDDPVPTPEQYKKFDQHELVRVVRMLGDIGEYDRIKPFILQLYKLSPDAGWRKLTATLARLNKRQDLAIWVAKRSSREGQELMNSGYPTVEPPNIETTGTVLPPEKPFVLAVIRQESAYRADARSPANAQGLMQLMPRTAKNVAKGLKVKFSRLKLTRDPDYNMMLGQNYLSEVLSTFGNSYVLALGAYNAGPNRVKQWIRKFGDPREKDVDAIDWVEMIPFEETRNYIQRVLENLQVYRTRTAETEVALRLESDLHK